jgi:hypothetical protein
MAGSTKQEDRDSRQPRQKARPNFQNNQSKMIWRYGSSLPSKHEDLSSNSSTVKKNQKDLKILLLYRYSSIKGKSHNFLNSVTFWVLEGVMDQKLTMLFPSLDPAIKGYNTIISPSSLITLLLLKLIWL